MPGTWLSTQCFFHISGFSLALSWQRIQSQTGKDLSDDAAVLFYCSIPIVVVLVILYFQGLL